MRSSLFYTSITMSTQHDGHTSLFEQLREIGTNRESLEEFLNSESKESLKPKIDTDLCNTPQYNEKDAEEIRKLYELFVQENVGRTSAHYDTCRGVLGFLLFQISALNAAEGKPDDSPIDFSKANNYLKDGLIRQWLQNHYSIREGHLSPIDVSVHKLGTTSFILKSLDYAIKLLKPWCANRRRVSELTHAYEKQYQVLNGLEDKVAPKLYYSSPNSIVMEFVHGITLQQYLNEHYNDTLNTKVALFCRLLSLLAICARCNVVHSDLSPNNIILTKLRVPTENPLAKEYCYEPKLIDFGVNYLFNERQGTPSDLVRMRKFVSKEILLNKNPSWKSDVFSLGMLFLELLARDGPAHDGEEVGYSLDQVWNSNPRLARIVEDMIDECAEDRLVLLQSRSVPSGQQEGAADPSGIADNYEKLENCIRAEAELQEFSDKLQNPVGLLNSAVQVLSNTFDAIKALFATGKWHTAGTDAHVRRSTIWMSMIYFLTIVNIVSFYWTWAGWEDLKSLMIRCAALMASIAGWGYGIKVYGTLPTQYVRKWYRLGIRPLFLLAWLPGIAIYYFPEWWWAMVVVSSFLIACSMLFACFLLYEARNKTAKLFHLPKTESVNLFLRRFREMCTGMFIYGVSIAIIGVLVYFDQLQDEAFYAFGALLCHFIMFVRQILIEGKMLRAGLERLMFMLERVEASEAVKAMPRRV